MVCAGIASTSHFLIIETQQSDSLFPWRTVYENCLVGLEVKNLLTDSNKELVSNGDLIVKYYSLIPTIKVNYVIKELAK